MRKTGIYIGTSGWTYDDWTGPFYPPDVKGAERLSYYAQTFDTVEVNASFYRTPTRQMIAAWNKRLGPDFHLVLKGPRTVTHLKKLRDIKKPLGIFLERALQLDRLEVVLWQLPPSLHRDPDRLDAFLALLPGRVRHAVEFRHDSWWDDDVEKVLKRYNAAFVAVSHPKLPDEIIPTADFLYARFHGLGEQLYNYNYSEKELADWAARLLPYLRGRTLYAFFNNDVGCNAVPNAIALRKSLKGMALKKAV